MRARGKARRELEMLAALEVEQDRLDDAKQAAAEDPSPENLTAKRREMASMAETRSWLRAVARIAQAERELVEYATATDLRKVAKREAAEADIERLRRDFGPLIAAMEQLAGAAPANPAEQLPPGSATVTPRPVRGRTRFGKDGA
ncbi:hypothetical protein [Streptosporangium minutum]|uniref:Uncharacterized protein n=1 Tax=Streptosporangium minutum TaxID=569862 RepID=A0A243RVU8_9ACTN|nr:hypothetical protein [Streptosporangium minutum]OUC99314.1 hypothetical protein CA984_03650 [Streptosporangium minutum]